MTKSRNKFQLKAKAFIITLRAAPDPPKGMGLPKQRPRPKASWAFGLMKAPGWRAACRRPLEIWKNNEMYFL